MIGQQAQAGFQAPEPYVPESAKAAGVLYEAGLTPSVINALQQAAPAPFDPVAYRNQFKSPSSGGLASVAQPAPMEPVNFTEAVPTVVQPKGYETGGPTVEFLPARGKGEFSPRQQMPSFYQQPMGMMAQPFNPMGYGPANMFNPYGGLGGISYSFQNPGMPRLPFYATGGLPLFSQGQSFRGVPSDFFAPPPTPTAPTGYSSFMPYGGFGYF